MFQWTMLFTDTLTHLQSHSDRWMMREMWYRYVYATHAQCTQTHTHMEHGTWMYCICTRSIDIAVFTFAWHHLARAIGTINIRLPVTGVMSYQFNNWINHQPMINDKYAWCASATASRAPTNRLSNERRKKMAWTNGRKRAQKKNDAPSPLISHIIAINWNQMSIYHHAILLLPLMHKLTEIRSLLTC